MVRAMDHPRDTIAYSSDHVWNSARIDADGAVRALLIHAQDCSRWGFVDDASDARSAARSLRVQALIAAAHGEHHHGAVSGWR